MVLGFILIGWIGGGLAAALHVGLFGGSALGAFGLFSLAGAGTILLTAAFAALPGARVLPQGIHGDRVRSPSTTEACLAELWVVGKDRT